MGKGPVLPNLEAFLAAGIDPKTGLPLKLGLNTAKLKEAIKRDLRVREESEFVNRFTWYNLPMDITSQELERMLYYRGQLCFFYDKDLEKFFVCAYALDGNIDAYGRYASIRPVPWTNGMAPKGEDVSKPVSDYFSKKKLKPIYGVKVDELQEKDLYDSAVILHDYTRQLGQQITPRQVLNDPILDVMADCMPFMRTSLLLGTGVKGIRVQDADQAASVADASRSMEKAALQGDPFIPVIGNVEMQELNEGQVGKAEEYMLAMQSIDNFRRSTLGLPNGGLFEKRAHELQSEAAINGGAVDLVLQDGLAIRQHFCNVINSIWGLGIWCEPNESIVGMDTDGDGVAYERDDTAQSSGVEAEPEGGEENE